MAALAEDKVAEGREGEGRKAKIGAVIDDLEAEGASTTHRDVFVEYKKRHPDDLVSFKQWKKASTKVKQQRANKKQRASKCGKIDVVGLKAWPGGDASQSFEDMVRQTALYVGISAESEQKGKYDSHRLTQFTLKERLMLHAGPSIRQSPLVCAMRAMYTIAKGGANRDKKFVMVSESVGRPSVRARRQSSTQPYFPRPI